MASADPAFDKFMSSLMPSNPVGAQIAYCRSEIAEALVRIQDHLDRAEVIRRELTEANQAAASKAKAARALGRAMLEQSVSMALAGADNADTDQDKQEFLAIAANALAELAELAVNTLPGAQP